MEKLFEEVDLSGMKRSELQKLAKQHGIKANMKTDGLIKALAALTGPEAEQSAPSSAPEQEAVTTLASSTEDQSEAEATEKPKSRRGRGRKQRNIQEKVDETSSEKPLTENNTQVQTETESESQTSSATEEDTASPPAKKSKAKGRGRGKGRRGRKAKEVEKEEEEEQQPAEETELCPAVEAQMVAAVPEATVISPAATGRQSRSRQATPASCQPIAPPQALPTPPNSGSSRKPMRALRRTTHTPPPAVQPTPRPQATEASAPALKRSSRSASKLPLHQTTPNPTPSPAPSAKRTRGSTGKQSVGETEGEPKTKRVRRGTFDKSPTKKSPKEEKSKPSNSSLKEQIMAEIERNVQLQVAKSQTSIPTRVQSVKKTPGKNWTKTSHGAMDKMESIDDYLDRKRKRAEALSATKAKKIPVLVKPKIKPKGFAFNSTKPAPVFNFASPKPNPLPSAPCTGTANPKSAKSVSFKVSKLRTPKGVKLSGSEVTDRRQATPGVRKSLSALTPRVGAAVRKSVGGTTPAAGGDRKSLGVVKTPSRKSFGGLGKTTSTTPAAKPKNVFDLKASLTKPLTYKPHTGKLKPFGGKQQNLVNVRAPTNIVQAKTLLKRPQLKGRADRRAATSKQRAQRRNDSFMANRSMAAC